jgi:alanine-alpha-ketoisovalerate/valine-pyruvate aminotransferase
MDTLLLGHVNIALCILHPMAHKRWQPSLAKRYFHQRCVDVIAEYNHLIGSMHAISLGTICPNFNKNYQHEIPQELCTLLRGWHRAFSYPFEMREKHLDAKACHMVTHVTAADIGYIGII